MGILEPVAPEASMLESNVDNLLKVRTDIDDELPRQITSLTILFTDVVGSTAYFEPTGGTDSAAMLPRHAHLASQAVVEFGGRVIKTIGDSVMAEFPKPVAGLRAAVAIQRRLADLNRTLLARDRVKLRIGINHGPSCRHDDDIYGDAVNIAGRITKLSGPGQILVLRSVREAARESGEFSFVDLGKVAMEGKTEMEDIFEVLWTDEAASSATRENLTDALQRGELVSPGLKLDDLVQPLEAGDAKRGPVLNSGPHPGRDTAHKADRPHTLDDRTGWRDYRPLRHLAGTGTRRHGRCVQGARSRDRRPGGAESLEG
jgi:class 3 adenylate cyclase